MKRTKLNKATDYTNEQKMQITSNVLGAITSWFQTGASIASDKINQNANQDAAAATRAYAEAQYEQQQQSSTNKTIIIAGVVVFVVLILVVVAVLVSKK